MRGLIDQINQMIDL